jgi:DNA-binding transcriptional ArsR family regulator
VKNEFFLFAEGGKELSMPKTRLEEYKEVVHRWLYIEDDDYIDVIFGTIIANRLDSDPVWLYLIAPPAGGKTEIVRSLNGHPEVYVLSTLTEKTLMSGYEEEPGHQGMPAVDPSLLPKLHRKVLVIKDFTSILDMQPKVRKEIIGQLRDAFDGSAKKVFGTGKDIEYKSKFGVIAATTSAIDKFMTGLADVGERFITYRLPDVKVDERKIRANMAMSNGSAEQQRIEIRNAAHKVLNRDTSGIEIEATEEVKNEIFEMADVVAYARTHVSRERNTKQVTYMPEPEIPTRLCKQFLSFGRGLAIVREKVKIMKDEIDLMRKIAWGCIPTVRRRILHELVEGNPVRLSANDLCRATGLRQGTMVRSLEDLVLLKLVQEFPGDGQWEPDKWALSEAKKGYLVGSGI